MKCKYCFAELEADVTVCPYCGKELTEEEPEEIVEEEDEIEEEYEITQVFDKILTNNAGINPLLGKYIFNKSWAECIISVSDTKIITPAEKPNPKDKTFILFLLTKKVIKPPIIVASPAKNVINKGNCQFCIIKKSLQNYCITKLFFTK